MNEKGNENGETSTSSTSIKKSQGQALTTDTKTEGGGNSSKKMKGGESSNSCVGMESGAGQSQESKEVLMDDLPPEMLMEILQCVDFRSLFKCRLVNRHWNDISSGILRSRSHPFTHFDYTKDGFALDKQEVFPYEKRSLRDFLTCIKNSKNCPFSQFSFWIAYTDDPVKFFKETDFMDLTSYFVSPNPTIKCLNLHFEDLGDLEMFKRFILKLRDLLLNKIPCLEELALSFEDAVDAPKVKLFPTSKQTNSEINPDQVSLPVPVQLPHLKVLRFEEPMISCYTKIFKDLLNAAVNLKSIRTSVYQLSDLQFLQSLGKVHLLKDIDLTMDKAFFHATKNDKNAPPSFPLPKLDRLDFKLVWLEVGSDSSFWSQAANFLVALFESSKDTLAEFNCHPIGCFPGLQLPTFRKLRKLDLTQQEYFPRQMFPPGIRARDFSTVSHLDLSIDSWDSAFPQEDSIPRLPNVKSLSLNDSKCKGNFISVLTLMCPNLEKFKMHKNNFYHNVHTPPTLILLNVGREIWTWMKKLEVLEFDVDMDLPENNSFSLDSCFTGITVENCERLYDLKEANKLLNKWRFQSNAPESVLNVEREHPSILEMRDLKTLIINPYSGKNVLKKTEFFTKLTWISEDYAFKFLPHFKPKPEPTPEEQV